MRTNKSTLKGQAGQLQANIEWEMYGNPFRSLTVARPITQPISTSPRISMTSCPVLYTGGTQIKQSGRASSPVFLNSSSQVLKPYFNTG